MKKTNNKGFSLVELIIVIAIMAILIGVLAPQYIKYVEKSRVSADKDVLDSVYNACNTAASDPDVSSTDIPKAPSGTTKTVDFTSVGGVTFKKAVEEILGTTVDGAANQLKSKSTSKGTITITVDANGNFSVTSGQITVPEVKGSSN